MSVRKAVPTPTRVAEVVGWPDEVRSALTRSRDDGRLVSVIGQLEQRVDGRVSVQARFVEEPPKRRVSVRWWWFLLAGFAAVGLIHVVLLVVAYWLSFVAAAVIVLGLFVVSLFHGGGCGGVRLHCAGCRG